jgi:iron complex transport system substrate-binding protein
MRYGNEDPAAEIKNRKALENIAAIKLNQVFAIDADSASRPSQNIVKALREMARGINPSFYEAAR